MKQLFIYYQPKQYTIHDTWEQYHLNESLHVHIQESTISDDL